MKSLTERKDTIVLAAFSQKSSSTVTKEQTISVRCENIKNRNIILIDDVLTTGATLTEAKKTLKKSGVKKIIAFTVAH